MERLVGPGFILCNARVAQLVEHNLAKVRVASSNLVSRSRGKRYPIDLAPLLKQWCSRCLLRFEKRGRRSMGVTNPPSMFDFYVRVRPSRVFNMKTEEKSTHQISGGKPTKLYYNTG